MRQSKWLVVLMFNLQTWTPFLKGGGLRSSILLCRVGQNHIIILNIYGACTVFFAGVSSNLHSYAGNIHSTGQPHFFSLMTVASGFPCPYFCSFHARDRCRCPEIAKLQSAAVSTGPLHPSVSWSSSPLCAMVLFTPLCHGPLHPSVLWSSSPSRDKPHLACSNRVMCATTCVHIKWPGSAGIKTYVGPTITFVNITYIWVLIRGTSCWTCIANYWYWPALEYEMWVGCWNWYLHCCLCSCWRSCWLV